MYLLVYINFDITAVDVHVHFGSVIKLGEGLYVRRTYTLISVSARSELLPKFSTKIAGM